MISATEIHEVFDSITNQTLWGEDHPNVKERVQPCNAYLLEIMLASAFGLSDGAYYHD